LKVGADFPTKKEKKLKKNFFLKFQKFKLYLLGILLSKSNPVSYKKNKINKKKTPKKVFK
jgi:hypothetical protein